MAELIPRLNVALEGRYRIERELGRGGMAVGQGTSRSLRGTPVLGFDAALSAPHEGLGAHALDLDLSGRPRTA